jgi:holo-[acyl-carrier protein] synthase
MQRDSGVVASALEILEIAELDTLQPPDVFSPGERAYAESKSDPMRRLAARLAAKRAACRLLGQEVALGEVAVVSGRGGAPRLELSRRAETRLRELGAARTLVSLTHGRTHAAASVLLLAGPG